MGRLIDADALKKYLDDCGFCKNCHKEKVTVLCHHTCPFPDNCDDDWARVIDEQPTIEERKKGKWVMHREDIVYTNGYLTKNEVVCSECGSRAFFDSETGLEKTPYCPFCGAKMEGAEE